MKNDSMTTAERLTNSTRFINAYNLLDRCLRAQHNFKTNITFSELIRRCASLNQVIRSYEDDLIELARLRNAIIHSARNLAIAEPHIEVVVLIEKIARIISTPPLALDAIKSVNVNTVGAESKLKEYILCASKVGHSNIPVYKGGVLVGVLQRQTFVDALGKVLLRGESADHFLEKMTIEEYLREFPSTSHFVIVSVRVTIEGVLELFGNRKLSSIIVTSDGTANGSLEGIITTADIIDLMQVLESY